MVNKDEYILNYARLYFPSSHVMCVSRETLAPMTDRRRACAAPGTTISGRSVGKVRSRDGQWRETGRQSRSTANGRAETRCACVVRVTWHSFSVHTEDFKPFSRRICLVIEYTQNSRRSKILWRGTKQGMAPSFFLLFLSSRFLTAFSRPSLLYSCPPFSFLPLPLPCLFFVMCIDNLYSQQQLRRTQKIYFHFYLPLSGE